MGFKDILKKSFMEGYSSSDINAKAVLTCMLFTALIALFIFFVYRVMTRKSFYNKNFNISLVAIALITAGIILTIQSSVVISLGMVGALSIIRFRTAIKDPMDLIYMFWAISVGIICGAGLSLVAILVSMVLAIVIFVLDYMPVAKAPMMLVITADDINVDDKVIEIVKKYSKCCTVKARNMTAERLDMTVEIRTAEDSKLLKELLKLKGIKSASILAHDGEVTF
ncbi:MAG: DUF4956 domain-containing protein [Lachnospiraceae bacterium]|nr:DUF4956 domain-containing protein [Lachnospiraceae bacterium]